VVGSGDVGDAGGDDEDGGVIVVGGGVIVVGGGDIVVGGGDIVVGGGVGPGQDTQNTLCLGAPFWPTNVQNSL
jgi:hypothetical protein